MPPEPPPPFQLRKSGHVVLNVAVPAAPAADRWAGSASENGALCRDAGAHERGDRGRRALMSPSLCTIAST